MLTVLLLVRSQMASIADILEVAVMFIVSQSICIPFMKKPWFLDDLSHPENSYGMKKAMNVRIEVDDDTSQLGGWFLQPLTMDSTLALPRNADEQFEEAAAMTDDGADQPYLTEEGDTVILYLHGNAATRSQRKIHIMSLLAFDAKMR